MDQMLAVRSFAIVRRAVDRVVVLFVGTMQTILEETLRQLLDERVVYGRLLWNVRRDVRL